MAKPIQNSSVQFTHDDLTAVLKDVWSSQFVYLARRDLRLGAEGFVVEAVKVTGTQYDLSPLAPHVPALKEALRQHQTDIAENRVKLGPPKRVPVNWYVLLKEQSAIVLRLLRAPVRPNECKLQDARANAQSSQGAKVTEHTAQIDVANEVGAAASSSVASTFSQACYPMPPADRTGGVPPMLVVPGEVEASLLVASTFPSPPGDGHELVSEKVPVEPLLAMLQEGAKTDEPELSAAEQFSARPGLVLDSLPDHRASEWEVPARLAEAAGPAFPCEVLSPQMRKFVEQLAEQTQVHTDVPAVWMLAAFGAAAAKGIVVEVQRGDRHPTNLWTAMVMPSGGGKTPTLDEIRRPFDEKQVELRAAARDARARRETELRVTRRRLRSLEKQAADAEDQEEREALLGKCATMQGAIFALERPAMPTLTTGDPTQASLTQLMGENDGKLLLVTDEGDQLFSRIGGGEGIESMLQAHSGATIERTRAGRHEIRVVAPSLSLVIGIQPAPFARVMATRAYHDKGFLARMLFIVLDVKHGARKQLRGGVDDATRQDYRNRIRRLLELSSASSITLYLASDALLVFSTFGARVDRDIALGELAEVQEWGNKLRGVAARLAGILHAADHALSDTIPTEVTAETMLRAIRIAEYFEAHALVAYGDAIRSAQDESAKKVWRWIADARVPTFRHGEAVRSLNGRLTSGEVAEALDRLVDEGYLRAVSTPRATRGRPSKATYRVNPLLVKPTEETDKAAK